MSSAVKNFLLLFLLLAAVTTAEAGGKKPKPTPTPNPGDPNYTRSTTNTAGTADQWSAGTNWDATPTSGTTTQLVFGNGTSLAAGVTIFTNNDIAGDFKLNILNFTYAGPASGTAPTVTVSGGRLEFISNGATLPTMSIAATGTIKPLLTISNDLLLTNNLTITATTNATLSGIISGGGTLTKKGGGTLTLSGANTFTAGAFWGSNTGTAAAGGILSLGSSSVGGPGSITSGPLGTGTFTIENSGAASTNFIQSSDSTTRTISNSIAFAGSSVLFNFGGTGDLIFDGPVALGGGGRTFTVNNTNTTFSGVISGTSGNSLTKAGTGTLILSGTNTYNGATTISAGTLQLGSGGTTGSLSTSSAITDNANLTINRSNAVTQGTDFSGSAISGSGSFTQAGSGTTTLTTANTYTGATTISGGTLQLGSGGTTGSLTGTSSIIDNANLTINHSDNFTQAGDLSGAVISGTGSFTQAGAGTTTLTLANTYAGNTNVNAGTLGIGATDTIPTSSNVTVSGGATLSFTNKNFTQTIGGLSGSGTVTATTGSQNFLTVGNGDASATFSGVIQDGGGHMGLTKTGTGTQILSGTNTYSLATTVNAGTLLVNNTTGSGTGSSAVTVNNSGSVLGGTGTISGSVSIASSGAILEGGTGTTGALQKLTISGALSMSSGSIIELALGAGGAHSTLALTGATATSFATTQHFSFINLGATAGLYDNIITGVTSNPFPTDTFTIDNSGFIGTFSYDSLNQAIDLNLTAIPEPSTLCAAALAFAVVSYTQRKRFARLIARA